MRNATMNKVMEKAKVEAIMSNNGRTFYERWGVPLKIVFVLKNIKDSQEVLRKICMDQNKVIVIKRGGKALPYAHTNMKVASLPPIFFTIQALIYIMTKRSKKHQKGIDFIFTDDGLFDSSTQLFSFLIPSAVIFEENMPKLCERALRLVKSKKEA